MSFRESIVAMAPGWLQGPIGSRFLTMLATPFDALADAWIVGVQARMPGIGLADALPLIGADRVVIRGFAEPDASYAYRLRIALDSHRRRGLPDEVLRNVLGWLSPTPSLIRHVSNNGRWDEINGTWLEPDAITTATYAAGGAYAPWNWDGLGSAGWSRFWLVLYAAGYATRGRAWGDGRLWGEGWTYGTSFSLAQVALLRETVRAWKGAHATCAGIVVAWDNTIGPVAPAGPMPDGTWGKWYKIVGGVAVPSRSSHAAYLSGVS